MPWPPNSNPAAECVPSGNVKTVTYELTYIIILRSIYIDGPNPAAECVPSGNVNTVTYELTYSISYFEVYI